MSRKSSGSNVCRYLILTLPFWKLPSCPAWLMTPPRQTTIRESMAGNKIHPVSLRSWGWMKHMQWLWGWPQLLSWLPFSYCIKIMQSCWWYKFSHSCSCGWNISCCRQTPGLRHTPGWWCTPPPSKVLWWIHLSPCWWFSVLMMFYPYFFVPLNVSMCKVTTIFWISNILQ